MSEGKILQLNGKHQEDINQLDVLAAIRAKLAGAQNTERAVLEMLDHGAQVNFEAGYTRGMVRGIYAGYTKALDDTKAGTVVVPQKPEEN